MSSETSLIPQSTGGSLQMLAERKWRNSHVCLHATVNADRFEIWLLLFPNTVVLLRFRCFINLFFILITTWWGRHNHFILQLGETEVASGLPTDMWLVCQSARIWSHTGLALEPTLVISHHIDVSSKHQQHCLSALHFLLSPWETTPNSFFHTWRNRQSCETQASELFLGKIPNNLHPQWLRRNKETNKSTLNYGPVTAASRITLLGHPRRWEAPCWWHKKAASHSKVIAKGLQYEAWLIEALGECALCRPWQNGPGPFIFPDHSLSPSRWGKWASNPGHSYTCHVLFPWLWLSWDYSLKRR